MARAVLLTGCGLALALAAAGCRSRPAKPLTATQVAQQYLGDIRDGKVEKAKALCFFESERAEKAWTEQLSAYLERRRAGHPAWWGEVFREQTAGDVAFIEVQWRYQVRDGWMMGRHYTYKMKPVGGEWRMWISMYDADRGVPFVPGLVSELDEEDEEAPPAPAPPQGEGSP